MPLYDFRCPIEDCDFERWDVHRPLHMFTEFVQDTCPYHGRQIFSLIVRAPMVDDWGDQGPDGRYFEHLGPKGMKFRDKKSYQDHLKRNHLTEWSPKTGMVGAKE